MLHYLFTTVYILVCFILLLVILLQQGKGGDMASAFGGSGSQAAFGARGGATLLTKLTTIFAVLFMLGSLVLSVIGQRASGNSVVNGTPTPVSKPAAPVVPPPASSTPAPAGTTTPATPAPSTPPK